MTSEPENFVLQKPSEEQIEVIERLRHYNVVVDSVAGSGKTTCNLHIAKKYPSKRILLLTYNARLKFETRKKISMLGLTNIEAHSYHSFCVKFYDRKCYRDTNIRDLLISDKQRLRPFSFDVFIFDEAQDVTPLYYQLICKIYRDNGYRSIGHRNRNRNRKQDRNRKRKQDRNRNNRPIHPAKICVLGDKYQSIYGFNDADERFVTFAEKCFNFNPYSWRSRNLSQSFRVPREISDFVNHCMLQQERIVSTKIAEKKPRYLLCNSFAESFGNSKGTSDTFDEVLHYLNEGYAPHEIFILAPSVRSVLSPVRRLENLIKKRLDGIPVYVPVSDDEKLDQDVLENKMIFSTFHQVKGLERKVVIAFGFDKSYFKYYKRHVNPNICPNELYVAVTRAKERLTVVHHFQNDYLPFLDVKKLKHHAHVLKKRSIQTDRVKRTMEEEKKTYDTPVSDLPRHLPQLVIDKSVAFLNIREVRKPSEKIEIPTKTLQKHGYENVSEITGTAIPTYFEHTLKSTMNILLEMLDSEDVTDPHLEEISMGEPSVEDLLYVATRWGSFSGGYVFKNYQIENFTWLSKKTLDKCVKRLDTLGISENAVFEDYYEREGEEELRNRKIVGFVDCLEGNAAYEFKCVGKLEKEHVLQASIYLYLLKLEKSKNFGNEVAPSKNAKRDSWARKSRRESKEKAPCRNGMFLYNILTDQLLQITCTLKALRKMMDYLIYQKYESTNEKSDERFLTEAQVLKRMFL